MGLDMLISFTKLSDASRFRMFSAEDRRTEADTNLKVEMIGAFIISKD